MQREIVVKLVKFIGVLLLLLPLVACAFVKPVKIFFPEVTGVECIEEWLCIDDLSKAKDARKLYTNALNSIELKLTKFSNRPKIVFCASADCFSKFGFSKSKANSIGTFGIVIGPKGWKPYYVKHELIHQWQSENFGSMSIWFASEWVIEGMAYSLSDDPRKELSEPFETYREHYNNVFGQLSGSKLKVALDNKM
jgi:hypothetical protein